MTLPKKPESKTVIRVGPAGWSYPDWAGYVYPSRRQKGFHEATFLAEFFDTIEINTSFYNPIRPEHAAQWIERVAANPRFGEGDVLGDRRVQMMAHHQHVQMLIDGVDGVGPGRIGRGRQHVRHTTGLDDVGRMAATGAFGVIRMNRSALEGPAKAPGIDLRCGVDGIDNALAMLALALYSGVRVSRGIAEIQSRVSGPISGLPDTDPRRVRFDRLHSMSTMLMTVNTGLGFVLLFWYARE